MELSSPKAINGPWKLLAIGSFLGFFILFVFRSQTQPYVSFLVAKTAMMEYNENSSIDTIRKVETLKKNSTTIAPIGQVETYRENCTAIDPIEKVETLEKNSTAISSIEQEETLKENSPVNPTGKGDIYKENSTTTDPVERVGTYEENSTTIDHVEKAENDESPRKCDIFEGKWVYKPKQEDVDRSSYDVKPCPFLAQKWNCRKNGRVDLDYLQWSWEANNCVIPQFNGTDMLERLRDKRMIVVGDSLNENQWHSLACLLYASIRPSSAVFDVRGRYKYLKAKDYNFKLEFYWSPFILWVDERHKSGRVLKLDKLPAISKKWRGADVMVFNSAHWWTHSRSIRGWDLFEHEGKLTEEMPAQQAFELGMTTWARWVSSNVDPNKTRVFYRSISPTHFRPFCYNQTEPIMDESFKWSFPKSIIETLERLIEKMNEKTNLVTYLNITKLSEYRLDAHPSVHTSMNWKNGPPGANSDCSHWCLPGLPDTWNRLLYASLFYS